MVKHIVQPGEHLVRIASEHGFRSHDSIWNHPGNSDLKKKRDNPEVLAPGDQVFIDDRYMIIGSANINERSMAGNRDSEIAVQLWPSDDRTIKTCIDEGRQFRSSIWAEHLGPKFPPANFDNPGSSECVKAVRESALENYLAFREGRRDPAVHGHLCLWPLQIADGKPPVQSISKAPEADTMIPDRPFGLSGSDLDAWRWQAPGTWSGAVLIKGKLEVKTFTDPTDETAE